MSRKVIAAGPFIGEFGWELMGFSGMIRFLKNHEVYKNHEVLVMTHAGRYPIYHDITTQIVPLPSWYTNLKLEPASYDAIGMTPQMYGDLIKYFRRFYLDSSIEAYEFRTPKGHVPDFVFTKQQAWKKLSPSDLGVQIRDSIIGPNFNGNLLVVMPRHRIGVVQNQNEDFSRARNWPPEYWQEVIQRLANDGFVLVIAGTQNGIPNINYNIPNVINLATIDPLYIMDATLAFMDVAIGTVCSQSGGTHLSLQAACPTWVIGHERFRHSVQCNPLQTACMYMETQLPYSNVNPNQAYLSILDFVDLCLENIHHQRVSAIREGATAIKECSICGSAEFPKSVKDLKCCGECGNFMKSAIPSKFDLISSLKDMRLGYMLDRDKALERVQEAVYQLDTLEKYSDKGKLYDVGCGDGTFMSVAQERGWEVHGNELSEFAVKLGKEKFDFNLQYGMLEDQVTTNDYDAFVLWHTLEHTINPRETLDYCNAHLKQGGVVQIAVPIKTDSELSGSRYESLHFYEFSVSGLGILLDTCGFDVVFKETRSPNNDTQVHMIGRKR